MPDPAASSGFLMEARCGPDAPESEAGARRAAFQAPLPPHPRAGGEHRHQPRRRRGTWPPRALPRSPPAQKPPSGGLPRLAELAALGRRPLHLHLSTRRCLLAGGRRGEALSWGAGARRCLAGAGIRCGAGPLRTLARKAADQRKLGGQRPVLELGLVLLSGQTLEAFRRKLQEAGCSGCPEPQAAGPLVTGGDGAEGPEDPGGQPCGWKHGQGGAKATSWAWLYLPGRGLSTQVVGQLEGGADFCPVLDKELQLAVRGVCVRALGDSVCVCSY